MLISAVEGKRFEHTPSFVPRRNADDGQKRIEIKEYGRKRLFLVGVVGNYNWFPNSNLHL